MIKVKINKICQGKIVNISLPIPSVLTYVLGASKNRLNETVLLCTHNICFGWEIRQITFNYALLPRNLATSST